MVAENIRAKKYFDHFYQFSKDSKIYVLNQLPRFTAIKQLSRPALFPFNALTVFPAFKHSFRYKFFYPNCQFVMYFFVFIIYGCDSDEKIYLFSYFAPSLFVEGEQ